MEGVMEGNGAGACEAEAEAEAPIVREGRDGREGVAACEAEGVVDTDVDSPTNGEPTSLELGSNPSRRAPKRQTSLFVK